MAPAQAVVEPALDQAARTRAPAPDGLPALLCVVREITGQHPDFRPGARPTGRRAGIVGDRLDGAGRPVFVSRGYPVLRPGHDAAGQAIIGPRSYIERRPGDSAPRVEFAEAGAVESAASFAGWFRDGPDVRRRLEPVEVQPGSASDGPGAFAAEIDVAGGAVELGATLVYRAGAGHELRFWSAGDLWAFVDGRLVVDLGGSEPAAEASSAAAGGDGAGARPHQRVELDRLSWLRDGETCRVRVFCASRGGAPAAPVRIESTAPLAGAAGAAEVAAVADVVED